MKAREPWYRDGLRFACRPDCGRCCVDHGKFSRVYLADGDGARLAGLLGLSASEFAARFVVEEDGHAVLRSEGPACVFLDGTNCAVYDARPAQCRTFPFWPENLRSRQAWERLKSFCPGVDDGPEHDVVTIRELAVGPREDTDADVS